MPFASKTWYQFSESSIRTNAPNKSGVYGIFKASSWVYVGESGDIQERLLRYANEANTCIEKQKPTGFLYELCPPDQRVNRQNQLIVELSPVCNQKLG